MAAARAWRAETEAAKWKGLLAPRPPGDMTIRAAAAEFIAGAHAGRVRTRSGSRYRLNVVQQYEALFRTYLLPTLGSKTLSGLRRHDVQELVDELSRSRFSTGAPCATRSSRRVPAITSTCPRS